MKKTYSSKPLMILTFIFNLILCYCSIALLTKYHGYLNASLSIYLNLVSSFKSIINCSLYLLVGVMGLLICSGLFFIYYVKIEKSNGILFEGFANMMIAGLFVYVLYDRSFVEGLNGIFKLGTLLTVIIMIVNLMAILRLDGVLNISIFDSYLPVGKENKNDGGNE